MCIAELTFPYTLKLSRSISMIIYTPTYLYIKQHSITGKLYFGKTSKQCPEKYLGSGTDWKEHIKKYGKEHVVTLWCKLFDNVFELVAFAISFSNKMDIVKSTTWLNRKIENGLDGSPAGVKRHPLSDEHKEKIRQGNLGKSKPQSNETLLKKSGNNHHAYGKRGSQMPRYGTHHTKESNLKNSKSQKGVLTVYDITQSKVVKIDKIEFEKFKHIKYFGLNSSKLLRNL